MPDGDAVDEQALEETEVAAPEADETAGRSNPPPRPRPPAELAEAPPSPPTTGVGVTRIVTKRQSPSGSAVGAGPDRRCGAGPGARHPGLPRQAVPHPERVDGPDARDRPARAGEPDRRPFSEPEVGDVVVFHPPAEGATGQPCGVTRSPAGQACDSPRPRSARTSTSSSASSPARATRSRSRTYVILNGKRQPKDFAPLWRAVQLPQSPSGFPPTALRDGARQPWLLRRQPLLGPRSRDWIIGGAFRHLLASRPSASSEAGGARENTRRAQGLACAAAPPVRASSAMTGRWASGSSRVPTSSAVAAWQAARRGRRAVRLRGADAHGPALAVGAERLQAARRGGARGAVPAGAAVAAWVAVTSRCVRGIDERGLHVTNLAALSDVLRGWASRAACA